MAQREQRGKQSGDLPPPDQRCRTAHLFQGLAHKGEGKSTRFKSPSPSWGGARGGVLAAHKSVGLSFMPITRITSQTRQRAQKLRREMTPPERALWQHLKRLKHQGHKFCRQAPIGHYIVDFVSFSDRLVIELDGRTHDGEEAVAYDKVRDEFLRSQGFEVLRFSNVLVLSDVEAVVNTILSKVTNDNS